MYTKVRIILISICFLLVSAPVYATDYKQWIPLLPETLGGLAQSGKPDGVNMEMGGQSWSSLQQKYSNNSENISMMIVSGTIAPQAQAFQMMSQFQMETETEVIKALKVSGHKALFQLNKVENKGVLMISANEQALVILEAMSIADEKQMIKLSKDIPLEEIAASLK